MDHDDEGREGESKEEEAKIGKGKTLSRSQIFTCPPAADRNLPSLPRSIHALPLPPLLSGLDRPGFKTQGCDIRPFPLFERIKPFWWYIK